MKWYVIDSQTAGDNYEENESIIFETKAIKSSLYDYSNVYNFCKRLQKICRG